MVQHHPYVHQDADRHEKQAIETVTERQDFGQCLMAIFRLRNDQAGNKRAQGEGQSAQRGQPGNTEAKHDDRKQKQLTASTPHDMAQEPRHEIPGGRNDQPDHNRRLDQSHQYRPHRTPARSAQDRRDEHHRNDRKVLEDQNRNSGATVKRIALTLFRKGFQHDGRAA